MKTEVVKIPEDLSSGEDALFRAAEIIKRGGLVIFPTETVYGLGANALDPVAVKSIYTAKGRPSDNPLIIHISDPDEAEKYTYTSETYKKLAAEFMPGPLTVIMPSRDNVPLVTRGGLPTVAVRCPVNKIAAKFIELCGVPIAAPSANLSGSPSPTDAPHVMDDMMGRVDMIIDGGECDIGLESTIVKIEDDCHLTLLRPGGITPEELRSVIPDVRIADAVTGELKPGERALSPGMKYRHYAPRAPLTLLDGSPEKCANYIKEHGDGRIAVIVYAEDTGKIHSVNPNAVIYDFGSRKDGRLQAHKLFYILREADKCNFDRIYAPLPGLDGIELALYNRMIRAAAHNIIKL